VPLGGGPVCATYLLIEEVGP